MQKWFPACRCAMECLLKAGASANCYSPARVILLSINTPIIRKSPHVNWNTRRVCLLHGQPGSLNCLEKPRLPHLSADAKSKETHLTVLQLSLHKGLVWHCCSRRKSHIDHITAVTFKYWRTTSLEGKSFPSFREENQPEEPRQCLTLCLVSLWYLHFMSLQYSCLHLIS